MSNADKKQPPKKSTNSYSLLLKSLSDIEKVKPQNSKNNNPKNPKNNTSDNKMSEKKKSEDKPTSNNANTDAKDAGTDDPDVPDRSYGDYYCKICDSHMNSDNMWDAHVTGKRHIKNVKKGDSDSKYEDLPDEQSTINYELQHVKEPIVGLSYIHEIRRKEPNVPPIYNCFLCHASIATAPLVTEHVTSQKHRSNYIKENDPDQWQLIEATNLKKGHMEPLVTAAVTEMEQKFGRGHVKVKQEKKKSPVITYSAKKPYNIEDISDRFDTQNSSRLDSSTFWKPVDSGRNFSQRDRSRSPREFEDNLPNYARSRSPRNYRNRNRMTNSDEERSMDSYRFRKRSISPRQNNYERSSISISPRRDNYGKSSKDLSKWDSYDKESSKRNSRSARHDEFDESISFTKRDMHLPRDDYNIRNSDSFARSLRKSDSVGKATYLEYENLISRDSLKKTFSSLDKDFGYEPSSARNSAAQSFHSSSSRNSAAQSFHSSSSRNSAAQSFHSLDNHQKSVSERETIETPSCAKSVEDGIKYVYPLGSEGCYKVMHGLVRILPEITRIEEMFLLTKVICDMQRKLKSKLSERLISLITASVPNSNSNEIIPGLNINEAGPSTQLRSTKSASNATPDVNSFINSILQSANMSPSNRPSSQEVNTFQLQNLSYQAINSQQAAHNSYQAPSTSSYQAPSTSSYQAPSTSSYQAPSTSSYQAPSPANSYQALPPAPASSYQASPPAPASSYQAPPATNSYQGPPAASSYQVPTGPTPSYNNLPFASGSASNYSSNSATIPGLGASNPNVRESQIYNYSSYSSSTSPSKNYPRKY